MPSLKTFIFCAYLFLPTLNFGQTNFIALVDSVIEESKLLSLYSNKVNWDSISITMHEAAQEAKTINELKPAFELLINALGDFHGAILDVKTYQPIARFTDWENLNHPDTRPRDPAVWKIINNPTQHFETVLLYDSIAYLKITGISPMADANQQAELIRAELKNYANQKIKSYIIDLRYNGGGNMNPMMSGLGPLIGEGIVAKVVNADGEIQFDCEIKNGNCIYFGNQALDLPNQPQFQSLPKVAVLTSRYTVSSGELVATAFKGRAKTLFFGEATGGYTTNNSWNIINDAVIINISTGIYADRNGNSYKINIPVDVEIPFVVEDDLSNNNCIQQAAEWLLKQ